MSHSKSSSASAPSFWDHPIEAIEEALSIRKQIEALQKKLSSLMGNTSTAISKAVTGDHNGKKTVSAATRAKIRAAQKARWAKVKGTPAKVAAKASPKSATPKKKTGGLTEEGRARLAAAMKARWAARKKGASAPNASK